MRYKCSLNLGRKGILRYSFPIARAGKGHLDHLLLARCPKMISSLYIFVLMIVFPCYIIGSWTCCKKKEKYASGCQAILETTERKTRRISRHVETMVHTEVSLSPYRNSDRRSSGGAGSEGSTPASSNSRGSHTSWTLSNCDHCPFSEDELSD